MTDDIVVRVSVPGKDRGGAWIKFGLEEYRVPPLGFGALQILQERVGILGSISGMPTREQMQAIVEIAHMAVKRNYPAMTVEELEEMLDLENFKEVLEAILSTSGYRRVTPGEESTTTQ